MEIKLCYLPNICVDLEEMLQLPQVYPLASKSVEDIIIHLSTHALNGFTDDSSEFKTKAVCSLELKHKNVKI